MVQKFKNETDFDGADFDELNNWIGDRNHQKENIRQFNAVIDSLKICDPAVGSGHFLVSALNEMLAIKSDLGLLMDYEIKRIRGLIVSVGNDQLSVTLEGEFFVYNPSFLIFIYSVIVLF